MGGTYDSRSAPGTPVLPCALAGFEGIARHWDSVHNCFVARILPGELYVSNTGEMITTVLGSCIAACVVDETLGVGGMNHFMLPATGDGFGGGRDQATRYGQHAMEQLINGVVKTGGRRDHMTVKIFGGGKMIPSMSDVGAQNIVFVRRYLKNAGFEIVSEDVGSIYPRKVNFFSQTGRALVKRLRPLHKQALADREEALRKSISTSSQNGDLELS